MIIQPSATGGDGVVRAQQAVPFSGGHEDRHDFTGRLLLQTDVLEEEAGGLARRKLTKGPGAGRCRTESDEQMATKVGPEKNSVRAS
jgi:hypothetical protein